mmetsp:Transcript_45550/g.125797  ORF Transcript_45550/g.125797 Transcript_45550/m.125797 type:complete len:196 (-) Transcript_45550:269-856(-)
MSFTYIPQREKWRTSMLLSWKKGDLRRFDPIVMRNIIEYAAPAWPQNPVRKLSINLIGTYTEINKGYYEAKKQWTGNFTWSDGQELVLNRRYDLKKQIGHGAFGVVMHAIDLQTGESVAIKIIKARNAYVGYHHIPTKTSHLKSGTYQQSPYMPADRQHKQKTINQPTTSQIYRASAARDSAAAESTLARHGEHE